MKIDGNQIKVGNILEINNTICISITKAEEGMVTTRGRPQITMAVGPARGKIPLTLWAKISFRAFTVSTQKNYN